MSPTIQTIDSSQTPLGEFLQAELRESYEFMAASAFPNSGGLGMIEGEMRDILESEGSVSIAHGADFRTADPDAIQTLVDMKTRYPQMSCRAAIGSSNLTLGGLRRNTERTRRKTAAVRRHEAIRNRESLL